MGLLITALVIALLIMVLAKHLFFALIALGLIGIIVIVYSWNNNRESL